MHTGVSASSAKVIEGPAANAKETGEYRQPMHLMYTHAYTVVQACLRTFMCACVAVCARMHPVVWPCVHECIWLCTYVREQRRAQ